MHFGGIEVAERHMHEGADGQKYLVLHGDEFDVVVRNARLLAYLGDWAYDTAIAINIGLAASPPPARHALLVVLGLGEAAGQACRQFHRRVPAGGCRGSAARTVPMA